MSDTIKPLLIVQSPLFTQSGYGHRSLDICKCLLKFDKYDLRIVPTRWGNTPQINIDELAEKDPDIKTLLSKILSTPLQEKPEVFIQISIPSEFMAPAKFNIGITAGIETTLPRGEWIEGVNRMDLTLVSSNFAKEGFLKTSYKRRDSSTGVETDLTVTKPIEVLFEGVDTNVYFKKDNVDSAWGEIKEDFAFLFVGHWLGGEIGHDRKDVGGLIRTFCETFKNQEKQPALILKTSCGTNSYIDQQEVLKRVVAAKSGIEGKLPEIYVIHGELTDSEINDLYNHPKVKAHVSFTHGEGYGRPLLEASISGKPVIASNWSGHVDFLNKNKAVLLSGTVKQVHPSSVNDWIIKEAGWFYVDYNSASTVLKDVYDNYSSHVDRVKGLSEENVEKFSLEKMSEKLKEILDSKIPEFPSKAKLVLPKLKKIGAVK